MSPEEEDDDEEEEAIDEGEKVAKDGTDAEQDAEREGAALGFDLLVEDQNAGTDERLPDGVLKCRADKQRRFAQPHTRVGTLANRRDKDEAKDMWSDQSLCADPVADKKSVKPRFVWC